MVIVIYSFNHRCYINGRSMEKQTIHMHVWICMYDHIHMFHMYESVHIYMRVKSVFVI